MKTLINKNNPQIRITAPEIRKVQDSPLFESYYTIKEGDGVEVCLSESYWTLIENGELSIEGRPVDLEKEYKECVEDDPVFSKLAHRIVGLAIARHFYELGRKGGNK